MRPDLCQYEACDNPIKQTPGKRARLYCSNACRTRANQGPTAKPDTRATLESLRRELAEVHAELAGMRTDIQSLVRALVRRRD